MSQEMDLTIPKHTLIILKQMCKAIRVPIKSIDFNSDGWYSKHSWTKEKEDSFISWMTDYLYNNKDAREELVKYRFYRKTKSFLRKVSVQFVSIYGWRLKE